LDIVSRERIIENQTVFITCSLGVSLYPKDGSNFNDLYKAADTAMRHLKGVRKNSYNFYTEDYHKERVNRVKLVNELRKAIEEKELYMLYQPIYDMTTMNIHSYEALIRWKSPTFGQVSPAVFIEHAENTNLISLIDEFVFVNTLKLRRKWHELGDHTTILSINLSSKGLVDPSFMHTVERLCLEYYYIPNEIQIEITETALISNFDLAKSHLLRLKRLGFIIALDDFGAGYSSLTYLHQLPIDCMKIDRSFSVNPGFNNNQDLILASIINLAHKLNLKVVAEGIETEKQKDFFLKMNCILGQGYLFAYPDSEENATNRLVK
jgi:EAL domain-containing protein (putative c-di-GMP-specific phosphodiesterase class I)